MTPPLFLPQLSTKPLIATGQRLGGWRFRERFSSRLLKTLSESFDIAQDERRGFEIVDDFPFMLRLSKHGYLFSAAC